MGNLFYWFTSNFVASRNFRLAVLWSLILLHLIINIFIFGMVETKQFSNFSDMRQNLYNHSFHHEFATNRELYPVNYYLNGLKTTSWTVWVLLLIWGVAQFFRVFGGKVVRAWDIARERTSAFQDAPDPEAPAAPAGTARANAPNQTQNNNRRSRMSPFWREFFSALSATLLVEGLEGVRRVR